MTAKGENYIERVVIDDWQRGSRFRTMRKQGTNGNGYTSVNMQVYDTGQLGVRPWLKFLATTGINTSDSIDNNTSIQWRPIADETEGELWVHGLSGDVWIYDLSALSWSAAAAAVNTNVNTRDNKPAYWGSRNDWDSNGGLVGGAMHSTLPENNWIFHGEANINSAGTVTGMTWPDASDELTNFVLYRDRVYAWTYPTAASTAANRLFYTDIGSYTTATTGNFFDIGADSDGYYILGVWALRDSLLICMSDGGWWVFTGTPGTGSLRYIGQYVTPAHGACGAVFNNKVYFISPYGRQVCIASPSGVDTATLHDVRPWVGDVRWTTFHDYRGVASQEEQSVHLFTYRNEQDQWWESIEMVNGAWVTHGYGRGGFGTETSNLGGLRDIALVNRNRVLLFLMEDSDQPAGSTEVQLYTRDIVLNRPSRSLDTWSAQFEESAADDGTSLADGQVRFESFIPPPGAGVRLHRCIVDFTYWKTTDDAYADVSMRCITVNEHIGDQTIDTLTDASLTADPFVSDQVLGQQARWIFKADPDEPFKPQEQVQLDNLMSIALDRVIIEYEIRPLNNWAEQIGGT